MAPAFPKLCVRIREVEANGGAGIVDTESPTHRWLPPEFRRDFHISSEQSWKVLTPVYSGPSSGPGRSTGSSKYNTCIHPNHHKPHDTTTMFYTTELNSWFEVPYDCTEKDVNAEKQNWPQNGWNRITFTTLENRQRIWMVGHAHDQIQIDRSINITDSWENLLHDTSFWNGVQRKNDPPTCGLAGKISIILGLIAFTAPHEDMFDMIKASFRPDGTEDYVPPWASNRRADRGLRNRRGLIIDIAYHEENCSEEEIENWEDGKHGAILKSNEKHNRNPTQNTNQGYQARPIQPATRHETHHYSRGFRGM